ncbi:hypothetical protein [Virgibacillus ihumii]|uniref:hypothetical protein n=1 Tax=Virgibacillus ihumii TaxID=2686091 RepID=UPI00157C485D|nr:hypothetical protein [Virgibacillus ihumii]
MNKQLRNITEYIREELGLQHYNLERHHIFREIDHFNKTTYTLSTEWMPDGTQVAEDGNPAGAAVVDINFHTREFTQITFVRGISHANPGKYPSSDTESAIEWIEAQTGLTFGRQFLLIDDAADALSFGAAVDNIPVSPPGTIEIAFNEQGQLTNFWISGNFPDENQIEWEPFNLTPEKFEQHARKQCELLKIPDENQQKWKAYYGIEEAFITNDGKQMIPFVRDENSTVRLDMVMEWDSPEPIDEAFKMGKTDFSTEVTVETALRNEAHPDTLPITEDEQKTCAMETLQFLQKVYPDDSGNWKLTALMREKGYLIAELQLTEQTGHVFERKIKVIIDPDQLTPVDYIDNAKLLKMFNGFQEADSAVVTESEAFEKLREHMEMEPVYVYDDATGKYILCGKLDCAYAVDAVTGETVLLNML